MSLSLGIVGLPNVGKSTLFNALVKNGQAVASNYPFCTIEPNVGVVEVPDPRIATLVDIVKPAKTIPAIVEFVDIAGIIKGASQGEGLGNQFLSHIRQSAAILLVARFFEDPDVIHVNGAIDPAADIETVLIELLLADLATVEKAVDRYGRAARGGDAHSKAMHAFSEKLLATLSEEKPARSLVAGADEAGQQVFLELQLITAKPLMIIANLDEGHIGETAESLFSKHGLEKFIPSSEWLIPISAKIEAELSQLSDEDRLEMLSAYGMNESGLDRLVTASYSLLGLQTYFTAGKTEVRAWTIPQVCTAPKAAAVIHTDFEKGFIRAETIAYADYVANNGEQGAKEAGKLRLEGKEYLVQDGDVLHFRFNV